MQFLVPQFIERNPKIFGPFTFKQFVVIGSAIAISVGLFFVLPYNLFILIAFIIIGGSTAFVFLKIGGEPLPTYLKNLFVFSSKSRIYVWKKKSNLPLKMAAPSAQDFLEIETIKDGIVILKNKTLRSVLSVSSLNFALKSEEEQNSILFQFQNFLNSLDFSCQILVQSRKLNMIGYLDKLEGIEKAEENSLLKNQIAEYRKFLDSIIQKSSIMQKNFYIVVPFSILETRGLSPIQKGKQLNKKITSLTDQEFDLAKNQLLQRVEFTILGLRDLGISAIPLDNYELAELFWSTHHQLEAENGYYPVIPEELLG